ncbi:MAG: TlpA family protein disulfide reductase [Acidobacteriota bacterium]
MRMRRVVGLLLVAATAGAIPPADQRPPFPSVSLRDRQGQLRPLVELLGEVTVLNFWATWCGPCRHELPELERLQAEFKGKPLKVLAINVDSPRAAVEAFIANTDLLLPVYFMDSRTQSSLGIDKIPFTVLLDGEGRVVRVYPGYSKEGMRDLKEQVGVLLGQRGGRKGT